jgi:hypothetical protein
MHMLAIALIAAGSMTPAVVAHYEQGVKKVFRHGRLFATTKQQHWLVLSEHPLTCDAPLFPPGHHAIAIFNDALAIRMITFNTSEQCYPTRHVTARIELRDDRAIGHLEAQPNPLGVRGAGDFDAVVCPTPITP